MQEADVLDVGQNVLLSLAKNLGSFHRDRPQDSFRAWLRRITGNAIRDHYRGKQKQAEAAGGSDALQQLNRLPDPVIDDSDVTQATEVQILYSRIVELVRGEFSARDWQAIHLVFSENQRPADVAAALGITRNQVYLAVSRVRKRLREEFGDGLLGKTK
jgi:RNA polymerase sigma-70 factor (ECF subfamily)